MDQAALKQLIQNTVLTVFAGQGKYYFPVAVSARHVHLSKQDFQQLFGHGKTMTIMKNLSQPGQFACEEQVELIGPKGVIKNVRVLGPERKESQVEISVSDSFVLGIKPEIRMSGDIARTPGCILSGPAGKLSLKQGLIVAARHVHVSEEQAAVYGIKDGDMISIKTPPPREGIIGGIKVRVDKNFDLEIHLDTDEANGNGIFFGTILERETVKANNLAAQKPDFSGQAYELITERDINNAFARGEKTLYCTARGLISPAAADRAKEKGISLCRLHG